MSIFLSPIKAQLDMPGNAQGVAHRVFKIASSSARVQGR